MRSRVFITVFISENEKNRIANFQKSCKSAFAYIVTFHQNPQLFQQDSATPEIFAARFCGNFPENFARIFAPKISRKFTRFRGFSLRCRG